jgi:hypothetical protein
MATNNGLNLNLAGQTGTGTFVGATSPTITAPIIAQINDTNGLAILNFTPQASAENNLLVLNAPAGNPPFLTAIGSDADINLSIQPKGLGSIQLISTNLTTPVTIRNGTGGQHYTNFTFANTSATRTVTFPDADGTVLLTGQAISAVPSIAFSSTSGVIGTTTNDDAAAGSVGEYISASVSSGSPTALSNGISINLTSISLTAGDWDVGGYAYFTPSANTIILVQVSIGTTSATLNNAPDLGLLFNATTPFNQSGINAAPMRFSLASTTTIYLVVSSNFSGSCTASGAIKARRRR